MPPNRTNPLARPTEEEAESIQRGALARNALGFTKDLARRQRDGLMDKAITEYRAGQLSPIQALAYIAQMAGLDDLRAELETLGTRGLVSEERRERNA